MTLNIPLKIFLHINFNNVFFFNINSEMPEKMSEIRKENCIIIDFLITEARNPD